MNDWRGASAARASRALVVGIVPSLCMLCYVIATSNNGTFISLHFASLRHFLLQGQSLL